LASACSRFPTNCGPTVWTGWLLPQWTAIQARALAAEVEQALRAGAHVLRERGVDEDVNGREEERIADAVQHVDHDGQPAQVFGMLDRADVCEDAEPQEIGDDETLYAIVKPVLARQRRQARRPDGERTSADDEHGGRRTVQGTGSHASEQSPSPTRGDTSAAIRSQRDGWCFQEGSAAGAACRSAARCCRRCEPPAPRSSGSRSGSGRVS